MEIKYYTKKGLIGNNSKVNTIPLDFPIKKFNLLLLKRIFQENHLLSNINLIKYYNFDFDGWVSVFDDREYEVISNTLELMVILFENKEDEESYNTEEERIEDLKNRLNNLEKNKELIPLKQISSNLGVGDIELTKNHSGNVDLNFNPFNNHSIYEVDGENDQRMIDVAFLYSNPLVYEIEEKKFSLSDPFDFERELILILDELNDIDQKIVSTVEAGTIFNLKEVLKQKPKIIHLFCNGGYINNVFYCFFEDENSSLVKLGSVELKRIFEEHFDIENAVELLIINTLFSFPMMSIFKEIPTIKSIISINSYSDIDEHSKKFLKTLYNCLFNGKSINSSFTESKNILSDSEKNKFNLCCCYHEHKLDCNWLKKYTPDNHIRIHEQHILINCICNMDPINNHKKYYCKDAIKYKENFDYEEKNNILIICCCSKEVLHNKCNKFSIYFSEDYFEKQLFTQENGKFERKSKNSHLSLKFNIEIKNPFIGRNIEIYEVIKFFNNDKQNNRVFTITADEGCGKSSFAKIVAAYMFERNYFPDGAIFVDKKKDMSVLCLKSIICNNLEIDFNFNNEEYLFHLIKNLKILFIFQFQSEEDSEFESFLKSLIKETLFCKVIIISSRKSILDLEGSLHLYPFDKDYSARLLLLRAKSYLQGIFLDQKYLEEHDLIKYSKGIPSDICNFAHWLRLYKPEQIVDILRAGLINSEQSNKCFEMKINKFSDPEQIKEVLFMIYLLPQGILDDDIINIYDKTSISILNDLENNNQGLFSIENLKEIKQKRFQYNHDFAFFESLDIGKEAKIKVYDNLFKWYTKLLRRFILNFFKDSPNEFSAAQNHGIWKTFNKDKENFTFSFQKSTNTDSIKARYQLIEENVLKLIQDLQSDDLFSVEIREGLEQFSICFPTILKIFGRESDFKTQVKFFLTLCQKKELDLAKARLELFFFANSKTEENIDKFNKINDVFNKYNIINGVSENHLCRLVKNINKVNNKIKLSKIEDDNEILTNDFNEAEKNYTFSKDDIGLARLYYIWALYLLTENNKAEFQIDKTITYFSNAAKIFKENGRFILQFRCLLGISKCHLINNKFDEAKIILKNEAFHLTIDKKKLVIDTQETMRKEIIDLENQINDKIQNQSKNLFTFLKAHQLVRNISDPYLRDDIVIRRSDSYMNDLNPTKDEIQEILPIVFMHNDFRARIIESLKVSKIRINLNFEVLNRTNLKKVIENGGKLLHICSIDYNEKGSVFIEQNNGESLEVFEKELNDYLVNAKFSYEMVILSIPQSENLAKIFFSNKVKYVVYFKFNEEFLYYALDFHYQYLMKIINNFTIYLTTYLIRESSMNKSFQDAKKKFSNKINELRMKINSFYLKDFEENESVFFLTNNDDEFKLNLDQSQQENKGNIIEDISKTRSFPVNVEKSKFPFIGRKSILYEILKNRSFNQLNINLFGNSGIGKTCIVKELAFYSYMRCYFYSIFYFNIKNIYTIEKLKEEFKEKEIFNVIKELENSNIYESKILLILDNCDDIIRATRNQFFLLLNSMGFDKIYVILTTIDQIVSPNMPCYPIHVPILSKEEQIKIFLNYCNRDLTKKEIDTQVKLDLDQLTIKDLLDKSQRLRLCYGYPKIIKKLAEICSTISLKYIKLHEFLPDFIIKNEKLRREKSQPSDDLAKTISYANHKALLAKIRTKGINMQPENIDNSNKINLATQSSFKIPFERVKDYFLSTREIDFNTSDIISNTNNSEDLKNNSNKSSRRISMITPEDIKNVSIKSSKRISIISPKDLSPNRINKNNDQPNSKLTSMNSRNLRNNQSNSIIDDTSLDKTTPENNNLLISNKIINKKNLDEENKSSNLSDNYLKSLENKDNDTSINLRQSLSCLLDKTKGIKIKFKNNFIVQNQLKKFNSKEDD